MAFFTLKCATTLLAYRAVTVTTATAETVKYPAASTELPIGVTIDDAGGSDLSVAIAGPGEIAKLLMNQTVVVGSYIDSDSSGRGVEHAAASTGSCVIGISLYPVIPASGGGTAGTGTYNRILVLPQWMDLP